MDRPKVKTVGPKRKRWRELQSRRSFKSLRRVHFPKQHNESSFMQDPPGVRQNAKETSNQISSNMSAKDNKDIVFSTNCNDNSADKRASSSNSSQPLMPVEDHSHSRFDEEYRKSSFDNGKDKTQDDHRTKTVRWLDEAEKSLMDLGISEDERNKRLESLMERRKSKKLSSFKVRTNGMGVGIGNNSCGQISSLNIPKKNPFLADSSNDPVSAPSYMVKSNPFDLPYDPLEEKPILNGDDSFEDHGHGPTRLGNFAPPEFTNYKHKTSLESDFIIKQLPSQRLVTLTVANKEDEKKQPQRDGSNPNHGTNDNQSKAKDDLEKKENDKKQPQQEGLESSEKVDEEKEINQEISINESSSSSSCSEDEPIMRPNKEAILRSLSMSRMRLASSQGKSFHRHAETFDCGPSALFDKSKTDCFYFGGNKKIHYASTNSIASDMQVEVSEVGSLPSTSQASLGGSTLSFDNDFNEVVLSDTDDFSDQSSEESGFSRTDHDSQQHEYSTFEKI